MKNRRTLQITSAAMLLAICIVSQLLKNISVYITGPIINACLILAVLTTGYFWAVILSVVTPITAFLITGAPIMRILPGIMPLIMAGNVILVTIVFIFVRKNKGRVLVLIGGAVGAVLKAGFMTLTIVYAVLAKATLPEKLQANLPVIETTYSLTQLITGLIGTALAAVVWVALFNLFKTEAETVTHEKEQENESK